MTTYKVSLTVGKNVVVFQASSPVTESRTANYEGFGLVHLPTDLWAYKNTSGRHFEITGKLVSRNAAEAAANSRYVDLIRSWILPDFGTSGATPPIVSLSAYNNTNINKVPCIIRSYGISFPDEVDWIFEGSSETTGTGKNKVVGSSAMPVICTMTIALDETYSAQQISLQSWKMNISAGGSFVNGGSIADVTAQGGFQGGSSALVSTPSAAAIAAPGFQGILQEITSNVAAGKPAPLPGNGSLTNTFGVSSSSLISSSSPASTSNNSPFFNGYTQFSLGQSTTQQQPNQSQQAPSLASGSLPPPNFTKP
jgi:hypothetical protein